MEYKTTADYKGIAREKLLGRYTATIGAILIMQLIFFVIGSITTSVVDTGSTVGMLIYTAILIITGLIGAVFTVGELGIYLRLAAGDGSIRAVDIFAGFKGHTDKAIILQFMIAIRCLVCMLPAIAVIGIFDHISGGIILSAQGISLGNSIGYTQSLILTLLGVVSVVAGMAGVIYIRLCTAQSFYLLIERPDMEIREMLDRSKSMMKGHMWEYLYMQLSFIPIALLGVLSMGIGLMYVRPYRGVTCTEYYLELASGRADRGRNIDVVIDD